MSSQDHQFGDELPVSEYFPVTWASENERLLLWVWDDIHSPLPASPMTSSIWDHTVINGIYDAAKASGSTSKNLRKRINGYFYVAQMPEHSYVTYDARTDPLVVASTRESWDKEFLPAIQADLQYMRSVPLALESDANLLKRLDEFLEIHRRHWYFHFLVVIPISVAAEKVAYLYKQVKLDVSEQEPYELFQGLDNQSLKVDRSLMRLADEASRVSEVRSIIISETDISEVFSLLENCKAGRLFLKSMDIFLSKYGYRPTGFDYVYPSWIEDPSFVIMNIRSYLLGKPRNLENEQSEQKTRATALLAEILVLLEVDISKRVEFLDAYQTAKDLWPLKEDHAFYIDQGSSSVIRILIAEMGKRLVKRNVLAVGDDVFYLDLNELKINMASANPCRMVESVAERKVERQRFMGVLPPRLLGTLPKGQKITDELGLTNISGDTLENSSHEPTRILRGIAASRGSATGPARLVRAPDEFEKVKPGDILVCTSTSPTWTPLFASIAGLVSDSGGALSHTAIVAREYRLPAVVGTKQGSSTIRDGQIVTVEGDTGLVILR